MFYNCGEYFLFCIIMWFLGWKLFEFDKIIVDLFVIEYCGIIISGS